MATASRFDHVNMAEFTPLRLRAWADSDPGQRAYIHINQYLDQLLLAATHLLELRAFYILRDDNAKAVTALKEICETRVRFGYRRVHVLLRREGLEINAKKTYRVYTELGMQLRKKTPKRRVKAKLWEHREEAVYPNEVWAMDFVHDQLATGRKIRILTVVDTFFRYVHVPDTCFSYKGEDVVMTLERICRKIGYRSPAPKTIYSSYSDATRRFAGVDYGLTIFKGH